MLTLSAIWNDRPARYPEANSGLSNTKIAISFAIASAKDSAADVPLHNTQVLGHEKFPDASHASTPIYLLGL